MYHSYKTANIIVLFNKIFLRSHIIKFLICDWLQHYDRLYNKSRVYSIYLICCATCWFQATTSCTTNSHLYVVDLLQALRYVVDLLWICCEQIEQMEFRLHGSAINDLLSFFNSYNASISPLARLKMFVDSPIRKKPATKDINLNPIQSIH